MFQIFDCIVTEHDFRSLAAAVFLCCIGAVSTSALWNHQLEATGLRRKLLFGLTVLTAACAVWSTHFVTMTGYVYGLDRTISMGWTLSSLVLTAGSYAIATQAMVRIGGSRTRAVVAALLLTLAVGGMHYTGIQAFRDSALVVLDRNFVLLSLCISFLFNLGAAICFSGQRRLLKGICTPLFFSLGVISLHFIAMTGLTLMPFNVDGALVGATSRWLTPILILAVMIIVSGGGMAVFFDRLALRNQAMEAHRLRALTTELKQANEEARRANAELSDARDTAERATRCKTRFLANMSHEIRTPMNGVLGMAEILWATSLTSDQREYVSVIQSSGAALIAIIDDILDISKIEHKKPILECARFDLVELLEDVTTLAAPLAEAKSVRLHLRIHPEASRNLLGDKGRVRQILVNLIGNAIKFTERGFVLIDLGPDDGAGPVEIRVRDTGVGIDAAHLPNIFDAFEQAETGEGASFGGTGLGLTISRTLATLMGGDIAVESRVGEGSTFRLTMGLERREAEPRARPAVSGEFGLVAADSMEREILSDMIRESGGEPVVFDDEATLGAGDGLAGAILCRDDAAAGAEPGPSCPVLVIAPSTMVCAEASTQTRRLRPKRARPDCRSWWWTTAPPTGS